MAENKLHAKLAKFKKNLESKNMEDSILQYKPNFEFIGSGSTVINLMIGGTRLKDGKFVCPGWPRKKISEIYGRESSGKSTIALMAMANALRENNNTGTGLYIDLEHAVSDNYAARLGVDFRPPEMGGNGRVMRIAPNFAEEVEEAVRMATDVGIDFIVLDSVAGLQTRREVSRDIVDPKDKKGVAEVPRFMSDWMPKLQPAIFKSNTHMMFLNQTRDKIGAMGFSEEALKSTTGGNALKFWASNRMMLKPKQVAKTKRWNPLTKSNEEVPISTDIEIKNIKNKIDARQGHTGLVTMRYGIGIDEIRTMINVAVAYKIVELGKNKMKQEVYVFRNGNDTVECVGFEKFRAAISKDPWPGFYEMCVHKMLDGMKSISDEELSSMAENATITNLDSEDDYLEEDGGGPIVTEATEEDLKELMDV